LHVNVPDRIQKRALLRAPLARVWRAISDPQEFGAWFGMALEGPFVPGQLVSGRIRPTTVDPEVAKLQEPHAGAPVHLFVEALEPPRRFSFRWHPYATAPGVDRTLEPTTLVELVLSESEGGTLLEITESGFDRLPLARRAEAFTANEGGWAHQLRLVAAWVERHAP
jgi:uncharacterized protein YndB with AHSA1/START domain